MGARILWLLGLGLAVGLLLVLFRPDERGARSGTVAGSVEAERAPAPAELVSTHAPDPLRAAEAPRAADRVESSGEQASDLPRLVRVLHDGAPAAGVEFVWATPEMLRAVNGTVEPDELECLKQAGRHGRTDARGEAELPPLPAGSEVAAWDGVLLALHRTGEHESSPIVLVLAADGVVRARVLDGRGAVVRGVPVALELETDDVVQRVEATSDAEGLVTFRHLGLHGDLDPVRTAGTVSIAGVFERSIEKTFPLRPWPTRPFDLVLPEHGSVLVELVDERGEVVALTGHDVLLQRAEPQLPGAMIYGQDGHSQRETQDGRARFLFVGLDLELEASCDEQHLEFEGPTRAGEEVVARLVFAGSSTELVFRVLDAEGRPLVESVLELQLMHAMGGGSLSSGDFLKTDAAGRARFPLKETWSEGTTLTLALAHDRPGAGRLSASVDLSRVFPPGVTDLGDILLAPAALLVAGRLEDGERPFSAVSLRVEASTESRQGLTGWNTITWGHVADDGTFALYDDAPAGALRLVVEAREYLPVPPIPFVAGTRDLVLELRSGGSLAGSIVAPPGIVPKAFEVRATQEGQTAPRTTRVESDGHFTLSGLGTGLADVLLVLVPGETTLLEVAGVAVQDGETTRDPRLQGVELAARVRRLRIGVQLADGKPAQGGWVRILDARGEYERHSAFVIEGGEARVLAPPMPLDLEVNVAGQRVVRLEQVDSDREITLEPAFSVRCELAPDTPLPPAGASLQLVLTPLAVGPASPHDLSLFRDGEEAGWWSPAFGDESNTFDERREVWVPIQQLGRYAADFHVVYGNPGGGRISFEIAGSEASRELEIDESSAGRTLRVEPDRARYAERLTSRR